MCRMVATKEKARPLRDEPDGRDATLHTVFGGRVTLPIRLGLVGPHNQSGVAAFRRAAPRSIPRLRLAPVRS